MPWRCPGHGKCIDGAGGSAEARAAPMPCAWRIWPKAGIAAPALRVLLLHGGPGSTHEYLEACDSYLPAAGVEY